MQNSLLSSSQELQELQRVVESLRERVDTLESEKEQVSAELDKANKDLEEERRRGDDIQFQSSQQIKTLGDENSKLKQEVTSLRARALAVEQQQSSERKNPETDSLLREAQMENARLKESLKELQIRYDKLAELQAQALQPSSPSHEATSSFPSLFDMRDIKSMSVEELRYHLQSDHNQLDVTTGYLHDLDQEIDNELEKHVDPKDLPPSTVSTHNKLRQLVRALESSAVPALQSSALSSENAYLRECVEMADRYLSRLVGDVSIGESDAKQRLRDRFEVVCRRSAKLMSEYQLLQTHAEQLRSETTHENADTARVLQGVQLLAEHMHVIKPRSSPSRKDLEEAIRRMDGIVLTQMPVVASKLKEYKMRLEEERAMRKRLETRIRELQVSVF